MKEHEDHSLSEALDKQTERWSGELSPQDHRLIQDIYSLSQAYAQENEHSLEQIWTRFAQDQEPAYSLQETSQDPGFQEGKTMQDNETQWSPTLASHAGKTSRRSLRRTLYTSLVAAMALVIVVGWALFSYASHPGGNPQTGSAGHPPALAKVYSSAQLLCHFADDNSAQHLPAQPSLDWSSSDQLAVTYSSLGVFDGTTCAQSLHTSSQSNGALWSPDHTRLLNESLTGSLQVLDGGTGKVLATFVPSILATGEGAGGGNGPHFLAPIVSVWSADGTSIISVFDNTPQWSVRTWSASTGKIMSTLLSVNDGSTPLGIGLSPDGKYIAASTQNGTEIWNISTKTLVSTLPVNTADMNAPSALAWSPDDASLALGATNSSSVQIWSVASGKQTASFTDESHAANLGALAWSPDGKYLAESTTEINLWDVHTQKIVATFGKVPAGKWVNTLAWSKDSSKLASTLTNNGGDWTQNTINLWKLS